MKEENNPPLLYKKKVFPFMSWFRKNGDRPHFLLLCPQVENVLFLTKWGLSPFFLEQKQRVLEPYSLSLSLMVAAAISQNLCLSNQL